jgi:N-acetyl-anhydromuramyl-L-alanine amidase AmpD
MVIKIKDKGSIVLEIQKKLKVTPLTGYFWTKTEEAVKKLQKINGLIQTGTVTKIELALLKINPDDYLSTDLTNSNQPVSDIQPDIIVKINEDYLDADEFFKKGEEKDRFYLHHTAGGHNPFAVKKQWNDDTRGRIGTHFIIGGLSLKGDSNFDGVIVKCIPNEGYAAHLGKTGDSKAHKRTVAVEICSYGYLKENKGKFYAYTGAEVPLDQVIELKKPFRGFKYFHKYSDKQIASLKFLINNIIAKEFPKVNLKQGLPTLITLNPTTPEDCFEFLPQAFSGELKGILTHTNVRKDKTDFYPDPRIINLLRELYNG